jgi:hypothetical protein
MWCQDAVEQIRASRGRPGVDVQAAMVHAQTCGDCRAALSAIDALGVLRDEPAPFSGDAMERAIDKAFSSGGLQRYWRGFWSGVAGGGALAATLVALAVVFGLPTDDAVVPRAVPEVRLALNEPRDVTVTLESPEPLANAEVRIELRGAVALDGYAGQRELRWMTDLDRGINQLTLPVLALDENGGQVLVEVSHGDRRRTFIVDVRGGSAG